MGSKSLEGRVAIVTGAAHGFGRQISLQLGELGAAVAACDIVEDELAETAQLLTDRGVDAHTALVDVSNEEQVNAFVNGVIGRWGHVDILVNNAGGTVGVQRGRPINEVPTDEWDRVVKVNLYGAFFFTRAVTGSMKERRFGKIVNISSGAGRHYSRTGVHAYTAAKAGLIGFTRQCARELGAFNINVNSVAPGLVMSTPRSQEHWKERPEGQKEATLDTIALHRLGTVEDIANAVVFLVTEPGSYVQGQTLGVDGGHWMF